MLHAFVMWYGFPPCADVLLQLTLWQEVESKPAQPANDGSVLSLLAKAIIDRRVQLREEGNDEEDEDDLLWD